MDWDLGVAGLGLLVAMSLVFGLAAHVIVGKQTSRWMWLIGACSFFVIGLLISEGWFGWATEEDLQPNYDGLSFDETLLSIFPSAAIVYVAHRRMQRPRPTRRPGSRRVAA